LFQSLRIKTNHDFVPNNNGRCRAAVVLLHQLKNCLLVRTDVLYLKFNTFLRKVGLSP
jgi:hypothetical protein